MRLSVIIPFYNEERTLKELVEKVISTKLAYEIICVDDGSTDKSLKIVNEWKTEYPDLIRIIHYPINSGKGHAIRKGLENITGEIILIQDADLEYDPSQYAELLKPFENNNVKVVYGSRNLIKNPKSTGLFYLGGIFLSKVVNVLYGSSITDESTGFKLFRAEVLKDIELQCTGFEFCPEVTAKILNKKININEVPIKYDPRSFTEGKKIKWTDGVTAVRTLIKYRFLSQKK